MASSIYHWFGQTFRWLGQIYQRFSEIMSSRVKSAFKLLLWPTIYMASVLMCWLYPVSKWDTESVNGFLLVLSVALGLIMIRPLSSPRIDDLNQFKNVSEIRNLKKQLSNYNRNVIRTGSWVAGVMIGLIVINLAQGQENKPLPEIVHNQIRLLVVIAVSLTNDDSIVYRVLPSDIFWKQWTSLIVLWVYPIYSILLGLAIARMVKKLLNVPRWNDKMSRLQFKGIEQAYKTRSHEATVENSTKDTDRRL